MINFNLDTSGKTQKNDRYWQMCVGSCHATTALREDYRKQLTECHRELGFKYLRFHGLFNDDMSVLTKSIFTGKYTYSFTNIDNIFDFLLSIGMKPFIELGFMPECIKSGNETIFHYKGNITPPSDENIWCELIEKLTMHLIERYGRSEVREWYFEVWNEPNLGGEHGFKGGRFWSGTMQDYFRLYEITVKSIKKIDSRLRVGGPATSNNAHIPDMIDFCRKNALPLDFISTHHYPTDAVLGYGVEDSQNFVSAFNEADASDKSKLQQILQNFLTFQENIWEKVGRGVLTDMAKRAKSEAGSLPLYYTEWNSLSGLYSDGAFGSSFIAKTVLDNMGIVDGYSYWTFTDIFEERSMASAAFHGGYGLMTLSGIKKSTYRAFELLAKLENERFTQVLTKDTIDCYAFTNKEKGVVQLLAVNHNSLLHDISDLTVSVTLNKAFLPVADVLRVDDDHANALEEWKRMDTPEYLNEVQLQKLITASLLNNQKLDVMVKDNSSTVTFTLPKQGIMLMTLYLK